MIDKTDVLEQIENNVAVWCVGGADSENLALKADFIMQSGVSTVSIAPDVINIMWPWFEKHNVQFYTRFYFEDKKITDKQISDITVRINDAFKHGATGAQVFLRVAALGDLVEQTHMVRDDLFFNKYLSIGIDISDVDGCDWGMVFANLRKINASSVVFVCTNEKNKTDFVGALYGMLNAWTDDNKFDLHFALWPDFVRIEQAWRLTELMRPGLKERMKFWVNV